MKDLYLMMSSEEVGHNFKNDNFNCVSRKKLYDTNSIAVDLLTIELGDNEFQFVETTLLGKGSRRVYSELILVE